MLSVRTTMITLVATLGVAAPGVVTTAAHASKNTGGYAKSVANKANFCDNLYEAFAGNVDEAGHADQQGKTVKMKAALDVATQHLQTAQKAGCDWAT